MNGILVVDKPQDFTSFDVVAKLRGICGERKAGHGGTLDPMATGVLPVFFGGATKAVDILPNERKAYVARVQTGFCTDTGDVTGAVTQRGGAPLSLAALEAVLPRFLGDTEQVPPMYSALRVNGKRLYELAREGKTVERAARPITVYGLRVFDANEGEGSFSLEVECSKGTYIRTLAEDICAAAGMLATLSALRRTVSCGFCEAQAHTIEEIRAAKDAGTLDGLLLGTDTAFAAYPSVELSGNLLRLFLNGFAFEAHRLPQPVGEGETVRVYGDGEFIGLGTRKEGLFKKTKQFWNGPNKG